MPPIVAKVEGRGNGIKTAVVNTSDVARALARPPNYVIKFFGFELGALTSINEDSDRYIVNGAHDAGKLQDLLDGFINKFVLCSSCKNPETDIIVMKDGNLKRDCKACGQQTYIDPRHKLSSYILKNPPPKHKGKKGGATASANVGGGATASEIVDAAGALDGDSGANGQGANGNDYDAGHSDDDELTRRINAEAQNLPSADFKAAASADNWTTDVSEEAVRARKAQLEKSLGALNIDDDDANGESGAAYEEFGEWVASIASDDSVSDVDIFKRAQEMGIDKRKHTVQVLAQTLFTDDIVAEIPQHAGLLAKLVTSESHQKALLGGIERLVGLQLENPNLEKLVPNILFTLYNNDLVSEDVVIQWGSRASKKYVDKETSKKVRTKAKSFIKWLQEQESESEEESSDEE